MKKIIFAFIVLMSFVQLTFSIPHNYRIVLQVQQNKDDKNELDNYMNNHEIESKRRYKEMQTKLDSIAKGDTNGLHLLTTQLEAQLKMEDFLIKFRESEHQYLQYTTVIVPAIVSIIVTLITLIINQYRRKSSPDSVKRNSAD